MAEEGFFLGLPGDVCRHFLCVCVGVCVIIMMMWSSLKGYGLS